MSKRISIIELRSTLERIIEHKNMRIEEMAGETNPQIVEIRNWNIGERNAFEAVLDALNGIHAPLRIYSDAAPKSPKTSMSPRRSSLNGNADKL